VFGLVAVLLAAASMLGPLSAQARGDQAGKRGLGREGLAWRVATGFSRPRFRARRIVVVRSADGFRRAWSRIRPGDEIDVRGVTFKGEVALANKRLPGWAEVHFDSATKFVGSEASENMPAVYLTNDSHVRFYGGDISDSLSHGTAGTGITLHDSSHVLWWDFVVHDVGGEGVYLAAVYKRSSYLDFKGEVYDWGRNLAWDPNPEKGTGMHAINVDDSYLGVTHSRLAIYAHDGSTGAGMSIGGGRSTDGPEYNTIYMWCRNLTMRATTQVAGNCIQFWGENDIGNVVQFVQAENLTGRPYDANGLYPGQSLSTDTVEHGRATNTNRNPELARTESAIPARVRWDRRGGTVFRDVRNPR
jgi:hypothetical protein